VFLVLILAPNFMNVSNRVLNLSRLCGVWGLRLTIAAPLVMASLLSVTARPLGAESYPVIAHNHGSSDHHEPEDGSDMHDMHDGDMHDSDMHDMHDMQHDEMHDEMHDGHHGHSSIEVDATLPIPQVAIAIAPDSASGWNLEIITTDFELTGATAGQANSPDQGHAHLYANGVKIARVYGNWYHIPTLPTGEVDLEVVLNSNQHQTLIHNGEPIAASTTIVID
jgi:hypothetical protein